jgi:hypothetical protein
MVKKNVEPLVRVNLTLNESDYRQFQMIYDIIGVSGALRTLMRAHLQKMEAQLKEIEA